MHIPPRALTALAVALLVPSSAPHQATADDTSSVVPPPCNSVLYQRETYVIRYLPIWNMLTGRK